MFLEACVMPSNRADPAPAVQRYKAVRTETVTARERQLLTAIRNAGDISRSELIKTTGLTGVAVFRGTEDLAARGLITIGATVSQGRGQPSATVSLNPRAMVSVGLSIMTDYAEAVILDFTGRVLHVRDLTIVGMPRAAILDSLDNFLDQSLEAARLRRDAVLGVGVAIAGFFIGHGAKVNPAHELDDWALIDLQALLEDRLGLPVMVENIAKAAAVGESLLGVGRRVGSFGYLNFAGGMGSGLVIDGELARGWQGNAGEIGGLMEALGLPHPKLDTLRETLRLHGVETTGITDLVTRYDDDWPGVQAWIEAFTPSFNAIAAAFRYVADCEMIVIGGRAPPALAQRIAATIRWPEATLPVRRDAPLPAPRVVVAEAPSESTAIGAATLPLRAGYFL
ncbi:ROK family transcriptional regulator [Caulobacter radicis]|uniref:ROK family transcriptional regulator n=1 Tax=Caulobacter radicis TaxID=2172650 RepID=UPI001402B1E1|nr:ROK family transcriptional regulator [Caulobacter radicis]